MDGVVNSAASVVTVLNVFSSRYKSMSRSIRLISCVVYSCMKRIGDKYSLYAYFSLFIFSFTLF